MSGGAWYGVYYNAVPEGGIYLEGALVLAHGGTSHAGVALHLEVVTEGAHDLCAKSE